MNPHEKILCEHYTCRCARARELLLVADRLVDRAAAAKLVRTAIAVHSQQVECRYKPEVKREQGDRGE
jgi:hypothetical protein